MFPPDHAAITEMNFIRALQRGNEVVITNEGGTRDRKITGVEVYFGWNVPHAAKPVGFVDMKKETSQ